MSYEITEGCVACGECADECPLGAIGQSAASYGIDQDRCTECGACAYVCDARAVVHLPSSPRPAPAVHLPVRGGFPKPARP